jgi:myo-inositol-1-phosphate synthase
MSGSRHKAAGANAPRMGRRVEDRTYQLNFGGNSDFKNMLERERLVSKKISKT